MGQVPVIGIIGNGRAASHFALYLRTKGVPCRQWHRRASGSPEQSLAAADAILVLTTDSQIEPFITEHPKLREKRLLHFSGALVTPLASGFHPLMAFGPRPYDLSVYESIPFICEEGGPEFEEIFPMLPNPHTKIRAELKPLYHALCVLGGNFSTMLWTKLFTELESRFGIRKEHAYPYLRQVTENLIQDPARALTGPVARRDFGTIRRNIEALEGDPFQGVYQAFVNAVLPGELPATNAGKEQGR